MIQRGGSPAPPASPVPQARLAGPASEPHVAAASGPQQTQVTGPVPRLGRRISCYSPGQRHEPGSPLGQGCFSLTAGFQSQPQQA